MRETDKLAEARLLAKERLEGSCNPTFGDEALDWVKNAVALQSRNLMEADYKARIYNYRLAGYERLHARLVKADVALEVAARRIRDIDQSANNDVARAIAREVSSEDILTALYHVSSELRKLEFVASAMTTPSREVDFVRAGLTAVGRESLLASMRDIGDTSRSTLSSRYEVYVGVTFGEDGGVQDTEVDGSGDSELIQIGLTLISSGNFYAIIAGVILVIAGAVISHDCKLKFDRQKRRTREAIELLPSKLVRREQQWKAFQDAESASITEFAEIATKTATAIGKVQERFKILFAANASRAAAASSVLTATKVEEIRRDLAAGKNPGEIRRQVALVQITSDIRQVNAAIARNRGIVLANGTGAIGLRARETHGDGLDFARSQFAALKALAQTAPVHQLLDTIDCIAQVAQRELEMLANGSRELAEADRKRLDGLIGAFADRPEFQPENGFDEAPPKRQDRAQRVAAIATETAKNLSFCILVQRGEISGCRSNGGETPYSGRFNDSGNPDQDILRGANDGGFSSDSRRVNDEISRTRRNIDTRIAATQADYSMARAGFESWRSNNDAALQQMATQVDTAAVRDQQTDIDFRARESELLQEFDEALHNFSQGTADAGSLRDLVTAVGGSDLRLPALKDRAVTPAMPEILGIDAVSDRFGNASRAEIEIERERRLAVDGLPANGPLMRQSERISADLEWMESASQSPRAASTLQEHLLTDAAALRYSHSTQIQGVEVATIENDGTIARRIIPSLDDIPANALSVAVRSYRLRVQFFKEGTAALRRTLSSGTPHAFRRSKVADTGDVLANLAGELFFEGDIQAARAALDMALASVDIATRFLPGISWGRDVYEAVSGKDLFSGAELSTFDRVSAVVGVLTAGVGNDGPQVLRAIKRLEDLPTEKAEAFRVFSRADDLHDLEKFTMGPHAGAAMADEGIEMWEVGEAVGRHTAMYSREHNSYLAVSDALDINGGRVAVAIDIDDMFVKTVFRETGTDAQMLRRTFDRGDHKNERIYDLLRDIPE